MQRLSTINADQNGKVSIWHDKSGNANNVTQTDVNKMPTLTPNQLNSKSVIQFDGINDFHKVFQSEQLSPASLQ